MKRKVWLIGMLVAVVVLAAGVVRLVLGGGSKQGVLKVVSSPTASVFLDNKHLGQSPIKTSVDKGTYVIRIVPDAVTKAYASWQGNVSIVSGALTHVRADLAESEFASAVDSIWLEKITSKSSEVTVATIPDGATVEIDGETKGITPISIPDMPVGDHTMTIISSGFVTRSVKIKTVAGYKLNAVIKLALSGEVPQDVSPSPTPEQPSEKPETEESVQPAKPFVTIKDTPTGFLRVRMEPTTTATEAAQVKPGEKYAILESEEDAKGTTWYQIKYDGTNAGWISGVYVEKTE